MYEAAADALGLSEAERLELLPSRAQAVYKNRTGWAHDRLKRAGLSSSVRRGYWKLTDRGLDYHRSHPQTLTSEEVEELALGNLDVRLRPQEQYPGLGSVRQLKKFLRPFFLQTMSRPPMIVLSARFLSCGNQPQGIFWKRSVRARQSFLKS